MMSDSGKGSAPDGVANGSGFICGVVEGFYGRPWTSEQRKELFAKLQSWGMNSYVYAPKDDCKHRAYWREMYTVEEADQLSGLIAAAKEHGITFYYALSPGLDMTYSSDKELATLKRKLEQVSQFGCEAFALLFDDIESEMAEPDKEVFQSFAHAQVTVTNEMHRHLNGPPFLFCPTQYCSTRAVPTVTRSEYLTTIGSKLALEVDVLWTGSRVISKTLNEENIEEIASVLRRRPLIWDNLHANDYDKNRVFLGPYSGRNPNLIPSLRGILTNPNCEFHANTIAIHTLSHWAKCDEENAAIIKHSASADIELETEKEEDVDAEELLPKYLSDNVYHPRIALRKAIEAWLPEFFVEKKAWGPITKPQPQVTMVVPLIPIIPSINTCMSLTSTVATSTNTVANPIGVTEVNTSQLKALADICSTVSSGTTTSTTIALPGVITTSTTMTTATNSSCCNSNTTETSIATPLPNVVMNSLVSPTKIVTNEAVLNPLVATVSIPEKLPITSMQVMRVGESATASDDEARTVDMEDITEKENSGDTETMAIVEEEVANGNGSFIEEPMECGGGSGGKSSGSDDIVMTETVSGASTMTVEGNLSFSNATQQPTDEKKLDMSDDILTTNDSNVSIEDLWLLCDLFYLPFEHGSKGLTILNEFHWLKNNASVLVSGPKKTTTPLECRPESAEWLRRANKFEAISQRVVQMAQNIARARNKELVHELYSYLWDFTTICGILVAFIKWMKLGSFPLNINNFTQGSYTWFSKGWKESFMSGDQEPWVFRGGLTADLQRLMPIDNGNDLFTYKFPDTPQDTFLDIRPYVHSDEEAVYGICERSCHGFCWTDELSAAPDLFRDLPSDYYVGPFLTISPKFSLVIEDSMGSILGYMCGALDAKQFAVNEKMCWSPAMMQKYPIDQFTRWTADQANSVAVSYLRTMIDRFHGVASASDCPADILTQYPSVLVGGMRVDQPDQSIPKRLATVLLAAFRSNGSFGVHTRVNPQNKLSLEFYRKLGFVVVFEDNSTPGRMLVLGRKF